MLIRRLLCDWYCAKFVPFIRQLVCFQNFLRNGILLYNLALKKLLRFVEHLIANGCIIRSQRYQSFLFFFNQNGPSRLICESATERGRGATCSVLTISISSHGL